MLQPEKYLKKLNIFLIPGIPQMTECMALVENILVVATNAMHGTQTSTEMTHQLCYCVVCLLLFNFYGYCCMCS
jgi:hypothetical protein